MMQHEEHEEYEFGGECHNFNLGLMTKVMAYKGANQD
jgi:hypothetical protein